MGSCGNFYVFLLPSLSVGLQVMKVAHDATQRDYECVLRTGVEGEEDQGIFINEAPHKWNVVYKCTLDSCPLFYTETEGACSCVFERLPTVAAS